MRRDQLEAMGVHLPVMATLALGHLPGPATWATRMLRAGVDVVASGAASDTMETFTRAREDVPFRPVKARPGDVADLVAAGATILETDAPVPDGVYAIGSDEAVVALIDGGSPRIEDPNVVARDVVDIARDLSPAHLWVVSTPGLHDLPEEIVEAKLAALAESAYRARLVFAKEQFDTR